jgi:acetyl-CoA carboxylase biotin carboxyl carrier protein
MNDIKPEDIEALVRTFDESDWDELRVVIDGLEVYLSKDPHDRQTPAAARSMDASPDPAPRRAAAAISAASPAKATAAAPELPHGMVAVRAPNLGTFYRAPKPGAPPYVSLGQTVDADTEICLIEVMKLFTPVRAGVSGIVRRILVEDAQLVEFDQPLFVIEPSAG